MASLTAHRRHFPCQAANDDELLVGPGMVLPDLPAPGPFGQMVLDAFAEDLSKASCEIEVFFGPGPRIH